jgi:hypothetical protein
MSRDKNTSCKRVFVQNGGLFYEGNYILRSKERTIQWTNYSHRGADYPDWKARKAAGLDVTTTYDAFQRSLQINPNGATRDSYGALPDFSFTTGSCQCFDTEVVPEGTFAVDAALQQQAVDKAYINFVKSYQKAVQTVQGGQFIGELRETLHFLKSPAKSLADLTRHYLGNMRGINKRYKRIGKDSAFLGAATGSYLSWKFGATPLLNDISDAKKVLDSMGSPFGVYHRAAKRFIGTGDVTTRVVDGYHYPGSFNFGDVSFGTETWFPWKREYRNTAIIRGGLYPYTGTNFADIPLDSLGLGIENWVPTVYEICPFSWMADYFSNLGDVIAAGSFAFVNLSWSNMTTRQVVTTTAGSMKQGYIPGDPSGGSPPHPTMYSLGGSVVDEHKHVTRGSMPQGHYFPDLKFKIPGLGQSLNFTAVINELTSKKGLIR